MNYEELIHEFLDGTLTTEKEEQFFISLSSSDELRTELKHQLAVKNAVKADIKAFTPRAESTLNIFNTLGFAPPAAGVATAAATGGTSAKFGSLFTTNLPYLLTSILSSVATAVILFGLISGGILNINNGNSDVSKNQSVIPVTDSRITENQNNSNSDISDKNSSKQDVTPKIIYKYIYKNPELNNDISKNGISAEQPADNIISDVNSTETVTLYNSPIGTENTAKILDNLSNFDKNLNPVNFNLNNGLFSLTSHRFNEFTFEMRGSDYLFGGNPQQIESNPQDLNNFAMSLYYNVNEETMVGLDYRRESFYQKFSGYEFGTFYTYEQQPNIESVSITLRYAPELFRFWIANPFIQTSLGGTKVGPVARIMLGTKFDINQNYNLIVGTDYSVLGYTHLNNWFFAPKYGFHLGFGINF